MSTTSSSRAYSLDALRGYAIVTMILSGTVAWGILPGWMYHAQLPPPDHAFDPTTYGITWVDLVFPFFLFAMGAAFPFSIGKKHEKGTSRLRLAWDCLLRGARLTFFAIFIQHMYPYSLSAPQDSRSWWLGILAFLLLFPMFMRIPLSLPRWARAGIEIAAYAAGILLLVNVDYASEKVFSLYYSNIIILLLANMALFGGVIYIFTLNNKMARIAILPFVMAVFLGSSTDGSWIKELFHFSPFPWIYKFYYLKYLFILIPGSIAGEYLHEWVKSRNCTETSDVEKKVIPWVLLLSIGLIIWNLYGLYTRQLILNLCGTVLMLFALYYLLRLPGNTMHYWRRLFTAGAYLLMLGLFFEAYEGGIRKDDSTYSYYFVTAGLAFFAMIAFSILCDIYRWKKLTLPLEMAGQNPMIAYVAPQLLVMPIIQLTGFSSWLEVLEQNTWGGFLRGVIVTALAVGIAILFTRIKWFWRT